MARLHRLAHLITFLGLFLLLANPAFGQASTPPKVCIDWGNVQNWTGTMSMSGSGSATDPVSGGQYISSESGTVTMTGTSDHAGPCNALQSAYSWGTTPSQVSLSNISIHDKIITPAVDANGNPCTETSSFDLDGGTGSAIVPAGAAITMNLTTNPTYALSATTYTDGVVLTESNR